MKQQVANYTFNAATGVVTLPDISFVRLDAIGIIINATRGVVMYNPADGNKTATVSGSAITLKYNTVQATMANTDKLLIVYDLLAGDGVDYQLPTQLGAGTQRIGLSTVGGIFYEGQSTAMAASATATGTTRTLLTLPTSNAFTTGGFPYEYRVSFLADVAGTAYLEVSNNASTWRRVKSIVTSAASGTGTSFYGEIIHRPSTRYVRWAYINNATAQSYFLVSEYLVAA